MGLAFLVYRGMRTSVHQRVPETTAVDSQNFPAWFLAHAWKGFVREAEAGKQIRSQQSTYSFLAVLAPASPKAFSQEPESDGKVLGETPFQPVHRSPPRATFQSGQVAEAIPCQ